MKIALDFDDTITRDPIMWLEFIAIALDAGHDIRIVTFRSEGMQNQDIANFVWELNEAYKCTILVIYTGGKRKRQHCYEQGFMVDVWIDDMPEIIVEDMS